MKVLVVGGGIGGISAALCLAKAGHSVDVFEQAAEFTEAGAGIQLSPNCSRVLHHLGLEAALQREGFLPEGTEFRSWRSGQVISAAPLGHTVRKKYGAPYYHIHRGDLLRILVDAAVCEPKIHLQSSARVVNFSQDDSSVTLQSESGAYRGDVLIGADGIHSVIRAALWGDQKPTFTGNVAWRAMVPAASLPEACIRPMSTAWWGPGKHFVHYYVRNGAYVNCVCVVEKPGWEVESWTEQGDIDELKGDFRGWHTDIQMLIDNADHQSLFKWALFDRPPMSQWSQGRVTLLGDACHPTLPFMAQGAAMAIEDGAVLASCLHKETEVAADLQIYERLRLKRTAGIQLGSRRNAKVFHMSGVKAWLRNRAAKRAGGYTMDQLFRYDALTARERWE